MCGRYSITLPPEAIREIFQTHGELPNWPAYYNAAPTTALPVVRQAKEGGRELVLMAWGLIPWFSKDGKPSYSTINARAEGVLTAASYREPFKTRRCIVPASGYFEWTGPKNDRQPHYFTRADGQPMGGIRQCPASRQRLRSSKSEQPYELRQSVAAALGTASMRTWGNWAASQFEFRLRPTCQINVAKAPTPSGNEIRKS